MRRGKDASLKALISAMAEAESKSYYEEQENALNDLSGLLKTFLNRDDSPERVRIRKDYEAGAALTGKVADFQSSTRLTLRQIQREVLVPFLFYLVLFD